MSTTGESETFGVRRLRSLTSSLTLRRALTGLAVLVIAVSGLFGGLHDVGRKAVPTVDVKQPFAGGPWTVTVNRALTLPTLEPLAKTQNEGDRWVAVRARIEITASETWITFRDVLHIRGVDGLRDIEPELYLVRDESLLVRALQPGLPEEVAFLWQQDGSKPRPEFVDIEIWGMTYRRSTLSDTMEWLDPEPVAIVLHVPVEDANA